MKIKLKSFSRPEDTMVFMSSIAYLKTDIDLVKFKHDVLKLKNVAIFRESQETVDDMEGNGDETPRIVFIILYNRGVRPDVYIKMKNEFETLLTKWQDSIFYGYIEQKTTEHIYIYKDIDMKDANEKLNKINNT